MRVRVQRRRESSWDRRGLLWGKSQPGSICSYHIPATKHRHPAKKKRNRSPFIIKGQEQLKSPTRQSLRRQEEQGFSRGGCVHASECKSKRTCTRACTRACTHTHTHTPSFPSRTKSHVHSHPSQGSSSLGCDSRATANAKPLLPLTVAMAI